MRAEHKRGEIYYTQTETEGELDTYSDANTTLKLKLIN